MGKSFRGWVIGLLVLITSTLTYGIALLNQSVDSTKTSSEADTRFWVNYNSYLRCLIVSDPEVVKALGKDVYFDECQKLLFEGTGVSPKPLTKVTIPTTTTTTN